MTQLMSPRSRRPRFRRTRRVLVATVLVVVGAPMFAWIYWESAPGAVSEFAEGAPKSWAKLEDEINQHPKGKPRHTYVPLGKIALDLQLAVVAGEDINFFGHDGFDWEAIGEAYNEWRSGERLRGASTLTQQLAKNLFLTDERSFFRKAREARFTHGLEAALGKRRILELYLNIVELGSGIYGVEAGARHYFGVGAQALSKSQAAELAAAIPSPLKHNPDSRTTSWKIRYDAIIDRMGQYDNVRQKLAGLSGRRSLPVPEEPNVEPPPSEPGPQAEAQIPTETAAVTPEATEAPVAPSETEPTPDPHE